MAPDCAAYTPRVCVHLDDAHGERLGSLQLRLDDLGDFASRGAQAGGEEHQELGDEQLQQVVDAVEELAVQHGISVLLAEMRKRHNCNR